MNLINIVCFDKNKTNRGLIKFKINGIFRIYDGRLRKGKITKDHQQIGMIRQMFIFSKQNYFKQCAKRLKIKPTGFVKAMKKELLFKIKIGY